MADGRGRISASRVVLHLRVLAAESVSVRCLDGSGARTDGHWPSERVTVHGLQAEFGAGQWLSAWRLRRALGGSQNRTSLSDIGGLVPPVGPGAFALEVLGCLWLLDKFEEATGLL